MKPEQIVEALLRENDFSNLKVGTKVHYTGDAANHASNGVITTVHPPDRWGGPYYDVKAENGDVFQKVTPQNFGNHGTPGGHRFEVGNFTGKW